MNMGVIIVNDFKLWFLLLSLSVVFKTVCQPKSVSQKERTDDQNVMDKVNERIFFSAFWMPRVPKIMDIYRLNWSLSTCLYSFIAVIVVLWLLLFKPREQRWIWIKLLYVYLCVNTLKKRTPIRRRKEKRLNAIDSIEYTLRFFLQFAHIVGTGKC